MKEKLLVIVSQHITVN